MITERPVYSGAQWLTDSVEQKWVVTGLDFYDEERAQLYFTAARGKEVGSHEINEQRKRHIFRISTDSNVNYIN